MTRADRFSPASCPRLVVKIGSALLVDPDGTVRRDWLAGVVADIAARHRAGQRTDRGIVGRDRAWARGGWDCPMADVPA